MTMLRDHSLERSAFVTSQIIGKTRAKPSHASVDCMEIPRIIDDLPVWTEHQENSKADLYRLHRSIETIYGKGTCIGCTPVTRCSMLQTVTYLCGHEGSNRFDIGFLRHFHGRLDERGTLQDPRIDLRPLKVWFEMAIMHGVYWNLLLTCESQKFLNQIYDPVVITILQTPTREEETIVSSFLVCSHQCT
ncbi:hypothetical protein ES702_03411 [subsurface metagenome]